MPYPSKISPDAIRAAAIALLEAEGESTLTLRRIAKELGVVPNALYRHYKTRNALIAAIADDVARQLLTRIDEALRRVKARRQATDPASPVRTMVDVYAKFAWAHPALYQTLVTDTSNAEADLRQPLGHQLLWMKGIEVLTPICGKAEAPLAAVSLWGLLHGMWALDRANFFGRQKPKNAQAFAIETFISGLAKQNAALES